MCSNRRAYKEVVSRLTPVLCDLPPKIIAIGGRPGVGKTTLGRFLAYRFNVTLVETDLFLKTGEGTLVYRLEDIRGILEHRRSRHRPVIIEGAIILDLLEQLEFDPDFTIHIVNQDAPESCGGLGGQIRDYENRFDPQNRSCLTVEFKADD